MIVMVTFGDGEDEGDDEGDDDDDDVVVVVLMLVMLKLILGMCCMSLSRGESAELGRGESLFYGH